jgi:hypothetical protein
MNRAIVFAAPTDSCAVIKQWMDDARVEWHRCQKHPHYKPALLLDGATIQHIHTREVDHESI